MSLRLVKRPKSPHWIMRGTIRGVRFEESTGTSNRKRSEEIRAKREAELHTELIYGKQSTATFAHAVHSYLESGGSHRFLTPILDYFGTAPLSRIDQDALDTGAIRLFPSASPSTRNRQFYTPVSAVLHHAAHKGWCTKPLIVRPKQPPGRIRWLEPDEAEQLIFASAKHLRPLVIFMLYTGARTGEALWLDWRDVNLSRAHVQFLKTKTRQPRGVPLHPLVVAALAALPTARARSFEGQMTNPMSGRLRATIGIPRQAHGSRRRSEERADALALKISTPTIAAIPGRRGIIGKTATLVRFRS